MFKKIKIVLCLFLIILVISCQSNIFRNQIESILGINSTDIIQKSSIDEFGGFGEGYTLEIYELTESSVKIFQEKPLKKLPRKDNDNWKIKDWSNTPVNNSYKEIFTLVLNYDSSDKLTKQLRELSELLKQKEVYYSFYYKPDKLNPTRVQFFVLDTNTNKFYAIDVIV